MIKVDDDPKIPGDHLILHARKVLEVTGLLLLLAIIKVMIHNARFIEAEFAGKASWIVSIGTFSFFALGTALILFMAIQVPKLSARLGFTRILQNLMEQPKLMCLLLLLIMFPGFVFFFQTPLQSGSGSIHDSVVSELAMIPSLAAFRHELINHFQLWWSPARGMGFPLMGNEIFASPLNPLTWFFAFLSQPIYWTLTTLIKLYLLLYGSYVFANRHLGLKSEGRWAFVAAAGLSWAVLGWINHTWFTSWVFGLWLLIYVSDALAKADLTFKQFLAILFLTFCTLSSGFPEAALMVLTLIVLWNLSFTLQNFRNRPKATFKTLSLLILAAGIGSLPNLPMIFQLLQMRSLALPRGHVGHTLFGPWEWTQWLIPLSAKPNHIYPRHMVGLVGYFLILNGMISFFQTRKVFSVLGASILITGLFWISKTFFSFGAVNLINLIPILNEAWWVVYFFPLILIPLGYFMALGIQEGRLRFFPLFLILLISLTYPLFGRSLIQLLYAELLFVPIAIIILIARNQRRPSTLLFLLFFELFFLLPQDYSPLEYFDEPRALWPQARKNMQDLKASDDEKVNFRLLSMNGTFTDLGFREADNRASAFVPVRRGLFLREVMGSRWNGMLPIQRIPTESALDLMGVKWVINPDGSVRARENPVPRTYVSCKIQKISKLSDFFQIINADTWDRETVYVDDDQNLPSFSKCKNSSRINAQVLEDQGNTFKIKAHGPGVLVLADNYFPGWNFIDQTGKLLQTFPAQKFERGILLEESKDYFITAKYNPWVMPPSTNTSSEFY